MKFILIMLICIACMLATAATYAHVQSGNHRHPHENGCPYHFPRKKTPHGPHCYDQEGSRCDTEAMCRENFLGSGNPDDTCVEDMSRGSYRDPTNNTEYYCWKWVAPSDPGHPNYSPRSSPPEDRTPATVLQDTIERVVNGSSEDQNNGSEDGIQTEDDGTETEDDDSQDIPIHREPLQTFQPTVPQVARATQAVPLEQLDSVLITEYMLRDWGGRLGYRDLPQWIELYNPNNKSLEITGYNFYYAKRVGRFSQRYTISEKPIKVKRKSGKFEIPPKSAIILATKEAKKEFANVEVIGGISPENVFVLGIPNVLKKGWRITDADDNVIHEIGTLFTNGLVADPILPIHVNRARRSYKRYASEDPEDNHFYGHWRDIGSPGFHDPVVEVANSPSNPYKPKAATTWAKLKHLR